LFHAAGHRVLVAESAPFHLCRTSRAVEETFRVPPPRQEPEAFLAALERIILKEKVDFLVPASEEVFTVAKGQEALSRLCKVWTEPLERLAPLHNKWTFLQEAEKLGTRVPKSVLIRSEQELMEALKQFPEDQPLVLKPVYSRFSSRIRLLLHRDPPFKPLPFSEGNPWMVQEFVPGEGICAYSVADGGRMLAFSLYRTVFKTIGGSGISFQAVEVPELRERVSAWLAEHQWTGQFAVDWIATPEGDYVPIECNPRTTSGIHLFAPEDRLDLAFSEPQLERVATPAPTAKRMITLAMLVYGLGSCRTWSDVRRWWGTVSRSRDVVFRWRDPFPFVEQFWVLLYFFQKAQERGLTLLEATSWDIEWNGEGDGQES
jgi:glutathione synthase/RimK-type ligase-like ATP-grasp enzyme